MYEEMCKLKDVEVKIHDARRQVEALLSKAKLGALPYDEELQQLVNDLAEAQRIMINVYLAYKNDNKETEDIIVETPSNVVEFPGKNKES